MKPPLKAERVLHKQGPSWELRDKDDVCIAQYMGFHDANLIVALVNEDYRNYKNTISRFFRERSSLLSNYDLSEMNEIEAERCCDLDER